jgi:hypothetical protein
MAITGSLPVSESGLTDRQWLVTTMISILNIHLKSFARPNGRGSSFVKILNATRN